MKYDDALWHSGNEDFPQDLPMEAGATHIALFLAWALCRGLHSAFLEERATADIAALKERRITASTFLASHCDLKLTDEMLSDRGNQFARVYFEGDGSVEDYFDDYERVLVGESDSFYRVADAWENFDRLADAIDKRYENWCSAG